MSRILLGASPTSSLNGWIDRETGDEGEWEFST